MSFCVIEGLVAEFIAEERVSLLDEDNIGALCTLDRSFMGRSHIANIFVDVFTLQTQYRFPTIATILQKSARHLG